MNKKLIITCLLLSGSFVTLAQSSSIGRNYNLPNILLPPPGSQNFMRYGEIPVDMSTGVPNISVPLYTLTSRKLQFPISASYHAAGIKVSDRASVIGLGWVLNIKGMLGITVMSGLNFDTLNRPTYKTAESFNNAKAFAANDGRLEWDLFKNMMLLERESRDWQAERMSFQLPTGLSGSFRYDFMTGNLIKLPFGPYQVERVKGIYPGQSTITTIGFVVIDDNGIRYTFGYPAGGNYNDNYRSMELLNMISADKSDTIRFTYKAGSGNKYEQGAFGSVLDLGDNAYFENGVPYVGYVPTASLNYVTNRSTTAERVLDSIISATTIIRVVSVADRADMGIHNSGSRVAKLEIYDRYKGTKVREINFHHSYFGTLANSNQRLRLDSLSIKGSSINIAQTYRFDYENSIQLPKMPEDHIGNSYIFNEDYWGYFNNSGGTHKIPQEFLPTTAWISPYTGFTIPIPYGAGTNRNPNHAYAKAALIKSITYPTGGKTEFVFEPNYAINAYSYPSQPMAGPVGGFRIYQIKNYAQPNVLAESKTYTYSPGYTRTITSDLFVYDQRVFKTVTGCAPLAYGSSDCWQAPNFATSVTHNIYTSSAFLPLTYGNGPPVFYEKVTEYQGDTVNYVGKTEYSYLWPVVTVHASSDHPRFQNPHEQDRGSYTPLLTSKIEYRKEAVANVPVRKTVNQYTSYQNSFYPTGLHLVHTSSYPQTNPGDDTYGYVVNGSLTGGFYDNYFSTLGCNNYYYVFDTKATQAFDKLTRTDVTTYGPDTTQKLVESTIYKYDTVSHLQPLEVSIINSTGDMLKTVYKYPVNFTGTAVYDSMIRRNIIAAIVEQAQYKNSSFLQSSKTNFYAWNATLIAPQTVESKILSNSPEIRLRYISYDSYGNVTTVAKENDINKTYFWGYNRILPVAEIIGVNYTTAQATAQVDQSVLDNPATTDGVMRTELQKLRNAFPGLQVVTYTYNPLIGMTSQTDLNDRTAYYEYDSFGRLLVVRDHTGNILKKYCYNYQGQIENCAGQ